MSDTVYSDEQQLEWRRMTAASHLRTTGLTRWQDNFFRALLRRCSVRGQLAMGPEEICRAMNIDADPSMVAFVSDELRKLEAHGVIHQLVINQDGQKLNLIEFTTWPKVWPRPDVF